MMMAAASGLVSFLKIASTDAMESYLSRRAARSERWHENFCRKDQETGCAGSCAVAASVAMQPW
jgi:hypothetical protein